MMKIVWRNPNRISPTQASVVQVWSNEQESGQVRIIYRRVGDSKGFRGWYEVLMSNKNPVRAA
jgi:hypothetical protein